MFKLLVQPEFLAAFILHVPICVATKQHKIKTKRIHRRVAHQLVKTLKRKNDVIVVLFSCKLFICSFNLFYYYLLTQ